MSRATTVTVRVLPDRTRSLPAGDSSVLHVAGAELELPTDNAQARADSADRVAQVGVFTDPGH